MPKITLEVYCDALPNDFQKFENDIQQGLSSVNQDYILIGTDYRKDDADLEQTLYQSLQSTEAENLTTSPQSSDIQSEKDYLLNLSLIKH